MAWLNAVLLLFGIFNIGLGLEAYLRVGSTVSLVAGGIAGALIIASVALAKTHPRPGRIMSSIVTIMLLGRFAPNFVTGGSFYPNGLITITSAIVLVLLVGAHFYAVNARKRGV